MRRFISALVFAAAAASAFCGDGGDEGEEKPKSEWSRAGESEVPAQKRPRRPEQERVRDLDNTDPDGRKRNADVLKFGLEDEILELLGKMTGDKDVRFVDEVYDLYEDTKSAAVREGVMNFFREMEDPCLEDYAVMILNSPFEESVSTVGAAFAYVGAVGTKAAVPAVEQILEGGNDKLYAGAIEALGKIGGSSEAMYLAEYFDREELSIPLKQALVRTMGSLKAGETFDRMVEMAENEDENTFVRMYAAEAVGQIGAADQSLSERALGSLVELYKGNDPNLRTAVVKGVANFSGSEAEELLLQATRDSHPKVRLEAVAAIRRNSLKSGVPYLVYRAKNDPEQSVKNACYPAIAELNTAEGNEYLVEQITSKKAGDGAKTRIAAALLEFDHAGAKEVADLALEIAADDRRKPLRYALGKEMAKWGRPAYEAVCREYMKSRDVATQGTALDIYAKGRYSALTADVQALADKATPDAKARDANAIKAAKILGIDWEKRGGDSK